MFLDVSVYKTDMGRTHRKDFSYAFHHVMNRAGARRWIFDRDEHRHVFFEIMERVAEIEQIEVHAYCLMGNHYHLLLRSPRANLANAMLRLGSMFTKRFNRMEKVDGPLFRGRYKSRIVGHDDYMRQLCRYIHRNPVAAGIVNRADAYEWSSYQAYVHGNDIANLKCLVLHELPNYFADPQQDKIAAMRAFVEADTMTQMDRLSFEELFQHGRSSNSGDAPFINRCIIKPEYELERPDLTSTDFDQVIKHVCEFYGVENRSLFVCRPGARNHPRDVGIFLAREEAQMQVNEIGRKFLISRTSASSVLARTQQRFKNDIAFETEVLTIRRAIRT